MLINYWDYCKPKAKGFFEKDRVEENCYRAKISTKSYIELFRDFF